MITYEILDDGGNTWVFSTTDYTTGTTYLGHLITTEFIPAITAITTKEN